MAHSVFISDLHLTPMRQDLAQGFVDLCSMEVVKTADALYILGDFLEFWIGDDTPTTGLTESLNCLKKLNSLGVKVYFQHGNRDFLIGDRFAETYQLELLKEHHVIDLYGQATLLLHGDTLCTDDIAYQEFRALSRSEKWQQEVLRKSLYGRIQYAQDLRKQSSMEVAQKSEDIMDVNQNTVMDFFERYQVKHMIHGHTHRPAEHCHLSNEETFSRVVLSDWHRQGQYYVVYDNGKTEFNYFDIQQSLKTQLKTQFVKIKLSSLFIKLYCFK